MRPLFNFKLFGLRFQGWKVLPEFRWLVPSFFGWMLNPVSRYLAVDVGPFTLEIDW